jgi:hypothetical protein
MMFFEGQAMSIEERSVEGGGHNRDNLTKVQQVDGWKEIVCQFDKNVGRRNERSFGADLSGWVEGFLLATNFLSTPRIAVNLNGI